MTDSAPAAPDPAPAAPGTTPTSHGPGTTPTPPGPAATPAHGRVEMQVRWSDVDLFGHVNNAAYLRYLDDARFALFPVMGVDEHGALTASQLIVVKHEIDFVAPLTFRPVPFLVEVWVPRIGRTSVDFGYQIRDTAGDRVYLRARSRMVQLDQATGAPRPFTDDERAVFAAVPGETVALHPW